MIDAIARGALAGGQIAVTVGCLLIAFIALIALANGILGGVGGWFGVDGLTFQSVLGHALSPVTVVVVTFALAGFANFGSIAIQIGTLGTLRPELRHVVAAIGLRALLAGSLANLSNAAIGGLVFAR